MGYIDTLRGHVGPYDYQIARNFVEINLAVGSQEVIANYIDRLIWLFGTKSPYVFTMYDQCKKFNSWKVYESNYSAVK